MDEDDDHLATEDILAALNSDKEAPWADWHQSQGLSAEKLRHLLKPFGVKSVQRQKDNERARGYTFGTLRPVFEHYLEDKNLP
jgi:hypothetical protein